jgi:hypothetical protein
MPDLVIQFPRDDEAFRAALETQFREDATIAEVTSFDGVTFFEAVVTLTAPLAPFVVDFLVRHLRASRKRIVLTREGEITLENYSADEAKKLLPRLTEESSNG